MGERLRWLSWVGLIVIIGSQALFVLAVDCYHLRRVPFLLLPTSYWITLLVTTFLTICGYIVFDYVLAPGFYTRSSALVAVACSMLWLLLSLPGFTQREWDGETVLFMVWGGLGIGVGLWRFARGATREKRENN